MSTEPQKGVLMTPADIAKIVDAAIKAAKEPDAETAQRMAEEKTRKESAKLAMIAEAKQASASKLLSQSRCDHKKQDGSSAVAGQVHSDGMIHPLCIHCFKEFKPYAPAPELVSGFGLNG